MPRLKKVSLIKATASTSGQQLPQIPVTTDMLPPSLLAPVTGELESPDIYPLFSTLPTTDKGIPNVQLEHVRKVLAQTCPQPVPITTHQPPASRWQTLFAGKPIALAGNTLLLGFISYLLFRHQRAYLFLSWYMLLLLWSYLTFKPVRLLFAQGIQGLRLLRQQPAPSAEPASKTYRSEYMRQLQGDTAAYMQALRGLHNKEKR
ncbi:hypothetical protein [Dictyobacter kobayashii]|uniref:Uncharacterized protein n=1 Tax=Dictyobacter kobayashii TaxID=2014872 RepID=A0A402AJE5_9CHLR|nr:hypothetical protein [Dictyobacter kobayashii]GCE19247.1 hypothetical protein KDK_30470 [Dictyobacter kobayashii]